MRQIISHYATSFYPFADDETPDHSLAAMGYINIITHKALAVEQKVDDKAVFNIQLRALTRDEWNQLKATVETAFDMQAELNSRQL